MESARKVVLMILIAHSPIANVLEAGVVMTVNVKAKENARSACLLMGEGEAESFLQVRLTSKCFLPQL